MPANDNLDPDEPWRRAQLLLEAHAKIAKSEIHPYDAPGSAVRSLLTDLMHYCGAHNIGKTKSDPEYLDFGAILKTAETDFKEQAKTMNAALDKARDATPDEEDRIAARVRMENDPKFQKLMNDLEARQGREAEALAMSHQNEPFNALRQEHERDAQARKFEDERQRYIRQYNKGRELAEQIQAEEKQKALELDQ